MMMDHVELADWRRRVFELYADVRAHLAGDPEGAHARWVSARDALFASHPQSPIAPDRRAVFTGLPVYPYDPALRFVASLDTDVEPERFPIGTSDDSVGGGSGADGPAISFVRIGLVDLPVGRLDVFWLDAYGGGLFLPFRDATSGETTYGGGRYLLDTVKGADLGATPDGALILDFNFSYHPSCFHDPQWACPLAPPGNRLDVHVEGGERGA